MFVQVRDNGSSHKGNSSGGGEKWSDAASGPKASAFGCVGRALRERGVKGASSGSGLLLPKDAAATYRDVEDRVGGRRQVCGED